VPAATPKAAIGGVALIATCFLGSAALRLTDIGIALAQEAAAGPAPEAAPARADSDALLDAIREREAQLEAEEARLAERAQTLAVAEEKLAEQLAAFEKAREGLEQTLTLADGAAQRDIAQITGVYERMKPEDAARIFEKMELSFAAGLLAGMKPDTAAQVLSRMTPEAAYAVTVMVTSRNANAPTE
jgi:flagellar motility protein MotE (MotC chaperone)